MGGWMDRLLYECVNDLRGWKDGRNDRGWSGGMPGKLTAWMGDWVVGLTDRWMDRWMDGWMNGWMDG